MTGKSYSVQDIYGEYTIKNKQVLRCLVSALLFLLSYESGMGQTLTTTIDKDTILIGQQIQYTVVAKFPENQFSLKWFDLPDSFSHFEVVNRAKPDTSLTDGNMSVTRIITLTSFDSGINLIPSFPVILNPQSEDSAIHLETDSLPVHILFSPLDSTTTFHDIKTIIEVNEPFPIWQWAIGALLLVLLAGCIILLVRYMRKRKVADLFEGKLSPYEEAMQSLAELKSSDYLSKGDIKEFHSRLADIFRRYISRRTRKNLLNHTSAEMLLLMQGSGIQPVIISETASVLRMGDAVKFAKFRPPTAESLEALESLGKILTTINETLQTKAGDS